MSSIFEETAFAGMKLKNRIFRSATHEGLADAKGHPTEELTNLFIKLAKGGVGAIITGYVGVHTCGKAAPNMRMFDEDKYIEDYQNINILLKEYSTSLILQVAHGGGQTSPTVTGGEVLAPSEMKYPLGSTTARELLDGEIQEIVSSFVQAIERAKLAGFDGVQLHAAHGYLLSEFLSPNMNRRKDRWGGSVENRFRIIGEILYRAREKVGSFPILMKYSAYDGDKNGMRIEDAIKIAILFQEAGGDAIEVSCGGIHDGFSSVRMREIPTEAIVNMMAAFKQMSAFKKTLLKLAIPFLVKKNTPTFNYNVTASEKIKAEVDIPVIVVGGIRTLEDIEAIIGQRKADYVALCRPFIIEPDIVNKFAAGKQKESRCINCGYCLLGAWDKPLRCYYGKLPVD